MQVNWQQLLADIVIKIGPNVSPGWLCERHYLGAALIMWAVLMASTASLDHLNRRCLSIKCQVFAMFHLRPRSLPLSAAATSCSMVGHYVTWLNFNAFRSLQNLTVTAHKSLSQKKMLMYPAAKRKLSDVNVRHTVRIRYFIFLYLFGSNRPRPDWMSDWCAPELVYPGCGCQVI